MIKDQHAIFITSTTVLLSEKSYKQTSELAGVWEHIALHWEVFFQSLLFKTSQVSS